MDVDSDRLSRPALRFGTAFGLSIAMLSIAFGGQAGLSNLHASTGPPSHQAPSTAVQRIASGGTAVMYDVASLPVGPSPVWGSFDSASDTLFVVNSQPASSQGSITEIVNSTVMSNVSVGKLPVFAQLDPRSGWVYVMDYGSSAVSIVNQSTLVSTIPLGFSPQGGGYNPRGDLVYALDGNGSSVAILNGTNIVGTVQVGLDPTQALFDPQTGWEYVMNVDSGNVSILNGTQIIGGVTTGGSPEGATYDPENGCFYIPTGGANVSVVRNGSLVGVVSVGSNPLTGTVNATYDPADGLVYVIDSGLNQVSLIDNLSVVGAIEVGVGPLYATADPSTGQVFVPNRGSDSVSIIHNGSQEVNVSSGKAPRLAVFDSVDQQIDVIAPGSNSVEILRLTRVFSIGFSESGLPSGQQWDVTLGRQFGATSQPTLTFNSPNGSFDFAVAQVAGYAPYPGSGTVNVSGANQTVSILFTAIPTPTPYSVTFTETTLPSGTLWWVELNGSQLTSSVTGSATYDLYNGSYPFGLGTSNGDYLGENGSFEIAGAPTQVPVNFTQIRFAVSFVESGLPTGTQWQVEFNGTAGIGIGTIVFQHEPSGSYQYSIGPISNYSASAPSGSIQVEGGSVEVPIVFVLNTSGNGSGQGSWGVGQVLPLAIGAGLLTLFILVSIVLRRRRRREEFSPRVEDPKT